MNKVLWMIGKHQSHHEPLQRGFHEGWIASASLVEFDTVAMTIPSIVNDSFVFLTCTCMEKGFREDHI